MFEFQICKCIEKENFDSCSKCLEHCDGLEWKWKESGESAAVLVGRGGSLITFHRRYSSGTAAVRGDTALCHGRHHYWELLMCNALYGTDIMVGVGTPNVALDTSTYKFASLLGLDGNSWGFSYTGRIQHAGRVHSYGPPFRLGDTVGVHLDAWFGTISFSINRKNLGVAFRGLRSHPVLYPMVCSTAAQISMVLVGAQSWPASLHGLSARALATLPGAHRQLRLVPGLSHLLSHISWRLLCGANESYYDDKDEMQGTCFSILRGSKSSPIDDYKSNTERHQHPLEEFASETEPNEGAASAHITETYLAPSSPDPAEVYAGLGGEEETMTQVRSGGGAGSSRRSARLPECELCRLKVAITIGAGPRHANRCLNCFLYQEDIS